MSYSPHLFLTTVIQPALVHIGLWSPEAGQLLLGTAIQESRLRERRQFNGGPARGLFQMEVKTHDDIWANVLDLHHALRAKVIDLMKGDTDRSHALEFNDRYAAALARLQYWRHRHDVMPKYNDIAGMAKLYKHRYNGPGKGTEAQFVANWHRHAEPPQLAPRILL